MKINSPLPFLNWAYVGRLFELLLILLPEVGKVMV